MGRNSMDDLRKRLRRLGMTPANELTGKAVPSQWHGPAIEELIPEGRIVETAFGDCFVVQRYFPHDTVHGDSTLSDWLSQDPAALAQIGRDPALALSKAHDLVFLDTETTGLAGGAGTLVFLVGLGMFREHGFEVRQFFLRDPAKEAAMLTLLDEAIAEGSGLVTFNGRTFDVPLLTTRYVLMRRPPRIDTIPHLDLLPPARRLWRRRLDSCALSALEKQILGLHRSADDVPGHLIPFLYRNYLITGDAHPMTRILYHNEIDILSMVTLGAVIGNAFTQPGSPMLPADDQLSLARWYQAQGMLAESEVAYRAVIDTAENEEILHDALVGLAYLLKRIERRDEAIPFWESLAALRQDVMGHEELAKHYEWYAIDLARALAWTDAALALAQSWQPGIRRAKTCAELVHRQARLLQKRNAHPDT